MKLLKLISALSANELTHLHKYLHSPYFNQSLKLNILFDELTSNLNSEGKIPLDKIKLFGKLYPDETYNDKQFRDECSILLRHIENYLGLINLSKLPVAFYRYSLKELASRDMEACFKTKSKEIKSILEKTKFKNNPYFLRNYLLQKDIRQYYEAKKPIGKRLDYFDKLSVEIESFIKYFIIKILRYYCILLRHENQINYHFDVYTLDKILEYAEKRNFQIHPAFNLFINLIKLIRKEGNSKLYLETKKLVYNNISVLEKDDLRISFQELFYYTLDKMKNGSVNYKNENYSIMNDMLKYEIYPLENEHMPYYTYIDFVESGLKEGKYRWVKNFIDIYKDKINPEQKNISYLLCQGIYMFESGNYRNALSLLSKIKLTDFYFHLKVKVYLILIRFETGNYLKADDEIQALKQYIYSHKTIPSDTKLSYLNFLKYLKNLISVHANPDNSLIQHNVLKIQNTKIIEHKKWLLNKFCGQVVQGLFSSGTE